jgi:hypothetical protein
MLRLIRLDQELRASSYVAHYNAHRSSSPRARLITMQQSTLRSIQATHRDVRLLGRVSTYTLFAAFIVLLQFFLQDVRDGGACFFTS